MKFYLLSFLTICSFFKIGAQNLEHSTLWKIEGPELNGTSYLFGTMHISCDASLNNKILKALDHTKQLVLELDMDDPTVQTGMMKNMMMNDGLKISDLLNNEDYQILDTFLAEQLGMGLDMMNRMKPFFIQASLYPNLIDCPIQSYELELLKVSQSQNEEIYGLETVEEQMKVFDDIPYSDQLQDLVNMAKDHMKKDKKMLDLMIKVYNSQNIEAMLNMMNNGSHTSISEYQHLLLDARNIKWIEKIESYAKDQPTFFGVGAGHLAGENGVIQLLKEKGYNLTAIKQ